MRALFLFHRDLRFDDNTAFLRACRECDEIICVFVFTPEQIDPQKNKYFSHAAVQFICESLSPLVHVHVFIGTYVATLSRIMAHVPFQRLYQNEDYSVYAQKRDAEIQGWCQQNGVEYVATEDYGLFPLKEGLVDGERPYTVLAQFYNRYLKTLSVRKPLAATRGAVSNGKLYSKAIPGQAHDYDIGALYTANANIAQRGGRAEALRILRRIRKYDSYKETRDIPADEDGTTKLSAHLRFGTVSVREVYWACVRAFETRDHPLIRELIFREFYLKIYALRPELQRGVAFHDALDRHVPWSYDRAHMRAWQTGQTGFPMVDAGMRQLAATNWCHNRVRMLVASVATKYLLLDWRDCARFFYTQLVDADTFSNTAGWGWASSTGVDATLWFRAPFNPFIQSKKFDKDAIYIQRWVPELRNVAPADIHNWWNPKVRAKYAGTVSYPAPIVDHKEASAHAVRVFKSAAAYKDAPRQ